ncbi:MAG TPA: flagellar biosynthesis anti-sigma factor FlgM [Geobacteraceae bacterium]|nr:flagellar biosynthesis anti-sigma factor FlgM [Geobacteraceae bacterium]
MKVDNILQKEMSVIRNEVTEKKSRPADSKDPAGSAANDMVSISSLMNNLNLSVATSSDNQVRTDKVASLKALIEAGDYNVSGQQVAEKMVSIPKKK